MKESTVGSGFEMDFLNQEVVTLLVGDAEDKFAIHQSLLEQSSSFFRAALSKESSFKEARTRTIVLPEDDVEVIQWYTQWLYAGDIGVSTLDTGSHNRTDVLNDETYKILLKLYAFADKYGIPKLDHYVIDRFFEWGGHHHMPYVSFNLGDIDPLYRHTRSGNQLRNLIIRWIIYKSPRELKRTEILQSMMQVHPEFAVDFALECAKLAGDEKRKDNPFDRGQAAYYVQ